MFRSLGGPTVDNGGGATEVREALARRKGAASLMRDKKLVIWAIAARDPRFVPFRVNGSVSKAQNVNAALTRVTLESDLRHALERDELEILGGVRFGRTLGGPVTVLIRNTEWPRWRERMSPDPIPDEAAAAIKAETKPRPGHADLVGMQKYDTHDARDILERASARETAARTVVGHLSQQVLSLIGVEVFSHVVAIGDAVLEATQHRGYLLRVDCITIAAEYRQYCAHLSPTA